MTLKLIAQVLRALTPGPNTRALVAQVLVGLLFYGCGSDVEEDDTFPTSEHRPAVPTCVAPPRPAPPGAVQVVAAFEDVLSADDLIAVTSLRSSPTERGRFFVSNLAGKVFTFMSGDDDAEVVLDIGDRLWREHREAGLFVVTLDQNDPDQRYLYVAYSGESTEDTFDNVISRFRYDSDTHRAESESEEVLLRLPDPHATHNVNDVIFDDDGHFFISFGDGRNPNDRDDNGQNPQTLYGSILRVTLNSTGSDSPYSIPEDNPFADGEAGAPEVYAWGLRNSWRMTYDPPTDRIFAGDVGQAAWEEVNEIKAGRNYGWPIFEGNLCNREGECEGTDFEPPLWSFRHISGGASITTGPLYRGDAVPSLRGKLIVGDYGSGRIWAIPVDGEDRGEAELQVESGGRPVSFTTDMDGEVYFASISLRGESSFHKLIPASNDPVDFPQRLRDVGCFEDDDPSRVLPGILRYETRAELWSDGAEKERFLHMPANRRALVERDGDLDFPVGSILIKTFGFEGRLHETRLMVNHGDGWGGYSYAWREDGSGADLVDFGTTRTLWNGERWDYPSRTECLTCHTQEAGRVLGVEYAQLDHRADNGIEETDETQFDYLRNHDYLAAEDVDLSTFETDSMIDPFGRGPLAQRARSYLHANCSSCHRAGSGATQAEIDLRFSTPLSETGMCNVEPEQGRPRVTDRDLLRILVPGDPTLSMVYYRMGDEGVFRMPPAGSNVVHQPALELIGDWIESLEGCED